MAIVKRERTTSGPPQASPTGRTGLLANAGIETPPAITAEVVKPVSTMPMIVFIVSFFSLSTCGPQFHQEKMPQFQVIFLIGKPVVLLVLKGLGLDKFWYHCHIYSLFI